jgi:hypothetical protein
MKRRLKYRNYSWYFPFKMMGTPAFNHGSKSSTLHVMSKKSSRWVPVLRTAAPEWRPPCCPPPPRRCRGCRSSSGWARERRSGCCRCCCRRPRPRRDPANPGAAVARVGCRRYRRRRPAEGTRGSGTWRSPANYLRFFRVLSSFYGRGCERPERKKTED